MFLNEDLLWEVRQVGWVFNAGSKAVKRSLRTAPASDRSTNRAGLKPFSVEASTTLSEKELWFRFAVSGINNRIKFGG